MLELFRVKNAEILEPILQRLLAGIDRCDTFFANTEHAIAMGQRQNAAFSPSKQQQSGALRPASSGTQICSWPNCSLDSTQAEQCPQCSIAQYHQQCADLATVNGEGPTLCFGCAAQQPDLGWKGPGVPGNCFVRPQPGAQIRVAASLAHQNSGPSGSQPSGQTQPAARRSLAQDFDLGRRVERPSSAAVIAQEQARRKRTSSEALDKWALPLNPASLEEIWTGFWETGPLNQPPIIKLMAKYGKNKWYWNPSTKEGQNNRKNCWHRRNRPIIEEIIYDTVERKLSVSGSLARLNAAMDPDQPSIRVLADALAAGNKDDKAKQLVIEKALDTIIALNTPQRSQAVQR